MRLVSKAPYNFITLENRVMKRYKEEKEFVTHDKYHNNYKSGTIEYELEVKTPLHISNGKDNCFFTNPCGKNVIPGNTIRGMTRYNASILSFASVVNLKTDKKDISDKRFYFRNFASKDSVERENYKNIVGMRQYTKNNYKYTILENVEAGYIRKRGDEYVITPAVKLENKSTRQGNKRGRLHSYIPVHEYELRKKNIKGANFLYCKEMKKEDYKKESRKEENINKKYEPYYMDIRYNINGDKPEIDMNGKFKGMLANSNYMNKKVHHYLIFEQDNKSEEIIISKAQAELYMDDLIYTKKMDKDKKEMEKKYKYYALPEKDEVKPVFYIKKDKDVLFGFTPYLRLSAKGSIYDGIPSEHIKFNDFDWVDGIFGWKGFKTRVSFLDAVISNNKPPHQEVKKMVLSEPKASWYKGYVQQRKSDSVETYNTEDFRIRGRKFYWMNKKADYCAMDKSVSSTDNNNIISDLSCIGEGTKFNGRIKYENLTDEELGLVLFALKQGDTEGYFNIGKGKPYGLGRCKINITKLNVDDISKKYLSFTQDYSNKGEMEYFINAFKRYVTKVFDKKDINEFLSYKEFKFSKEILSHEATRYMDVRMFSERKELPTSEEVIGGKVDKESSIIKDTKNQKPKSEYKYNDKKNKGKGNPEKFNMTKINKNEGFNTLAEELKRKGFYTE